MLFESAEVICFISLEDLVAERAGGKFELTHREKMLDIVVNFAHVTLGVDGVKPHHRSTIDQQHDVGHGARSEASTDRQMYAQTNAALFPFPLERLQNHEIKSG